MLFLSSDVEQDAPPYFATERGIREGLPAILDMLDELNVKVTFFVVGRIAERYPGLISLMAERGHEIGSHGYTHRRLDRIPRSEAVEEVLRSLKVLRDIYEVKSFRAPNLKLPRDLLGLLRQEGVRVDSSLASYKPPFAQRPFIEEGLVRVPASFTSSVIRLPWWALRAYLEALSPLPAITVFVHPWEVSGMRHPRPDISWGTGPGVLAKLKRLVRFAMARGYEVHPVGDAEGLVNRLAR